MTQPQYTYGPDTTLAGLIDQFQKDRRIDDTKLASLLSVKPLTIANWKKGEQIIGLLTRCRADFERQTGISIDRWLVANAKQELLKEDPHFAQINDLFERFQTRDEIIEHLRQYEAKYGTSYHIEMQIRLPAQNLSRYFTSEQRPTGDHLKSCLLGVFFPLIDGNRDDVVFTMLVRNIFGKEPTTLFTGVKTFHDAVRAMFALPSLTNIHMASVLETRTCIKKNTIARLKERVDGSSGRNTEPRIIALVLRALVKELFPTILDAFDKALELLSKNPLGKVQKVAVGDPQITIKAQRQDAKTIQSPMPVIQPQLPKVRDNNVPLILEAPDDSSPQGQLRDIAATLEGLSQTLLAIEIPKPQRLPASELVGETIDGIHHCISAATFTMRPGEGLTGVQIELARKAIEGLRKLLVVIAELDEQTRNGPVQILARELDELFLALAATRFKSVVGAFEQLEAQRRFVRSMTENTGG
ncbi:MAG: hypothetical protein ABIH21_04395 [Patescibacteria group bacterium]